MKAVATSHVVETEAAISQVTEVTKLQVVANEVVKPPATEVTTLQAVAIAIAFLSLAVLVEDELEKEHVEDEDEEGDGDPEERGQAAKVMAVLVQRQHMVLMGWSCKPQTNKPEK